ncbi:MAG: hypothetical protein AAF196_09100 [Planctomycetota bacterium]
MERSRAEIETLLARHGATEFASGWSGSVAALGFVIGSRAIRFELPLPDRHDREFTHTPSRGHRRQGYAAEKAWEQACRSRWRALLLVIKAKLEAVEVGISSIEKEFLAWTVLPGGQTVHQQLGSQIQHAIEHNEPPRLLIAGGGA